MTRWKTKSASPFLQPASHLRTASARPPHRRKNVKQYLKKSPSQPLHHSPPASERPSQKKHQRMTRTTWIFRPSCAATTDQKLCPAPSTPAYAAGVFSWALQRYAALKKRIA